MTDAAELVKRLRDPEFFSRTGKREELLAAADEIERLSSTAATLDVMAEVGFSMAMRKGDEVRAAQQAGAVTDAMVKAGAAAMCCNAQTLGCAAKHLNAEFTVCQLHTFMDDARRCLEAARQPL